MSGKKNVRKSIPESVRMQLWGRAAGRCQFDGCNRILWRDDLTKAEFNSSYVAHIVADSPTGPRGHATDSERFEKEMSNLMLMCDVHHRMIDNDVLTYTVERLREMKQIHEERLELLTGICPDKITQMILFGANIGEQNAMLNENAAKQAIIPDRYPTVRPIMLGMTNSVLRDDNSEYWSAEVYNLEHQYSQKIHERLMIGEIRHMSVFGIAPQPLLIKLGSLMTDIHEVQVHQLHREPQSWRWREHREDKAFIINEPNQRFITVALKVSLSARISDERVMNVLGPDVSIWELTSDSFGYSVISSKEDLSSLRQKIRELYARIKEVHGEIDALHVFPAMPVSAAIEFGRVRNPKADVPLVIYDRNKTADKFESTIRIR